MTCVSRRRGRCSCLLSTVEHQSHQAMAISCILLCLTLIVRHTMSAPLPDPPPHADTELDAAVTPGQEGPLGANSPNLNYCCGPSGYCKPCKDQTRPVGGLDLSDVWKINIRMMDDPAVYHSPSFSRKSSSADESI